MSQYQSNYQSQYQGYQGAGGPGAGGPGIGGVGGPGGAGGTGSRRPGYVKNDVRGDFFVDYKAVDDLRRLMTPNGKIYSRKRLAGSAREQRLIAQAIKRARYMALLPYTSATL